MFVIIETGGKQYKVSPQTTLDIEKIAGKKGDKISFDKILLISDGDKVEIGTPYIKDTSLSAEIVDQKKGDKIRILRFRAKSRHRRRQGHRQLLTTVKIGKLKTAKPAAKKASK